MKKLVIILTCTLVSLCLFSGCTDQKDGGNQDTNLGAVEIDDTDLEIDAERKPYAEENADSVDLPEGFTYRFKDPENADGIVVTPKE